MDERTDERTNEQRPIDNEDGDGDDHKERNDRPTGLYDDNDDDPPMKRQRQRQSFVFCPTPTVHCTVGMCVSSFRVRRRTALYVTRHASALRPCGSCNQHRAGRTRVAC